MASFFSTFTTSPLLAQDAVANNPFFLLETQSAAVAHRISLALCYADDVHTLTRCLSFGDRVAGRIEYFAVQSATNAWLDGAWLAPLGHREGLARAETFRALQEAAWAYMDVIDARADAERAVAAGKVG